MEKQFRWYKPVSRTQRCRKADQTEIPHSTQGTVRRKSLGYTTIMMPIALHPPTTTLPVRPARISDTDLLRAHCWPNRTFLKVHNQIARVIRNEKEGRGFGLVMSSLQNIPIAYGQFTLWPSCGEISDLVVAEPYRGQGLGTQMIQCLILRARQIGVREVEIGAAVSNPRAAALYRRLGFEDSHHLTMQLEQGTEKVLFLRLSLVDAVHHHEQGDDEPI